MKRAIITIGFLVLMVCGQTVSGANKYFYSSGQILPGETWDNVYIYNDNTVVDMLGGQVGSVSTYDISTFNFSGGQITRYININRSGTTHISNGVLNIGDFVLYEDSYGLISGGSVTSGRLKMYYDSIVDIKGGLLHLYDFDMVWFDQLPTINIYGYDFDYTGGVLSGYLIDGNLFSISGVSESEYSRFNLIPEPTSFLLLGIGGLFLKKRYCTSLLLDISGMIVV